MTEGRLFRSADASGPLADSAEVALQRPRSADSNTNLSRETGAAEPNAVVAPTHAAENPESSTRAAEEASAASVIPAVVPPIVDTWGDGSDSGDADSAPGFEHLFGESATSVNTAADIPGEDVQPDPLEAFTHLFDDSGVGAARAPEDHVRAGDRLTNDDAASAPVAAAVVSAPSAVAATQTSNESPATQAPGLAALRSMEQSPGPAARSPFPAFTVPFRAVVTLIVGSTLLTGTIEALIAKHIGIGTGIVSVLITLACSFRANPADRTAAIFALPTAWLLCALLAGQLVAPSAGSWIFRQVVVVLQVLGDNAWWIIIGTAAAWAINSFARFAQPAR